MNNAERCAANTGAASTLIVCQFAFLKRHPHFVGMPVP